MTILEDKIIDYSLTIAKELDARLNRLRVFVRHNVSSGNANELILRDFLSRHAPGNYDVGQGFIYDLFGEQQASKQCDILIYDKNNEHLVYSDRPIKIVLPTTTRMVIEVKTNFDRKETTRAIENITATRRLMNSFNSTSVIFA